MAAEQDSQVPSLVDQQLQELQSGPPQCLNADFHQRTEVLLGNDGRTIISSPKYNFSHINPAWEGMEGALSNCILVF